MGIDLSLRSTGVAAREVGTDVAFTRAVTSTGTKTDPLETHGERARTAYRRITDLVRGCDPELVVIESAYFNTGAADTSAHRRAGLWWMVVTDLLSDFPVAEVAPATLKKFVTGEGRASKARMQMAIGAHFGAHVLESPGGTASADDLADAVGLAEMGCYAAGRGSFPRTAYRNATMGAVAWPETGTRLAGEHDRELTEAGRDHG